MAHPLPPNDRRHLIRGIVADAVHDAVCRFSASDGYCLCQVYTVAGYSLLNTIDGPDWVMQAGSAWILADPPDGYWHYDAKSAHALARGEFHCWLAKRGATKDGPPVAFVDFTARHFHRTVDDMSVAGAAHGGERMPWTHTVEPPAYIWTDGTQSEWVRWEPLPDLCQALWVAVVQHADQYRRLQPLLVEAYRTRLRAHGLPMRARAQA